MSWVVLLEFLVQKENLLEKGARRNYGGNLCFLEIYHWGKFSGERLYLALLPGLPRAAATELEFHIFFYVRILWQNAMVIYSQHRRVSV